MITFKSDRELAKMRQAGRIVADILKLMKDMVKPGVDTYTLDQAAEALVLKENAKPAFKGYKVPWVSTPFPGTICASVNDEIVHGIPSRERVLQEGDIISIDTGASYNGFFGDAACTFAVGKISEDRQRLLDITLESLHRGMNAVKVGATLGDIGYAIENLVIPLGFGLVRDYAGHGIGRKLHEAPQVPNFGKPGTGITLKAGMTFCIEPMVMDGAEEVKNLSDNWTVVTADGSDAAHFENSLLVTNDGVGDTYSMGVIPDLQEGYLKTGDVVLVRQGKNKGKFFVVVKTESEARVFIANGVNYSVEKPKKKNVKHLQKTLMNLEDVAGRVAGGKPLDNGWLIQKFSVILDNSDTSWRQGG